jgi:hypothetical protein
MILKWENVFLYEVLQIHSSEYYIFLIIISHCPVQHTNVGFCVLHYSHYHVNIWLNIIWCWLCEVSAFVHLSIIMRLNNCLLHLLACLCVWQELSNIVWPACCKTVYNSPADALSLCLYVTISSTWCDLLYLTKLWLIRYREGWSSQGLTEMEKYWTTQ